MGASVESKLAPKFPRHSLAPHRGERGCPVLHSMRDETSQAVEQTKMREAVALVLVHSGTELWHKAVVFAEEGSQAPTVRD